MKKRWATMLALILAWGFPGSGPHAATRILAITPRAEPFQHALEGLRSDLGANYEVVRFDADLPDAADSLGRLAESFQPQGLVLMDSKAIGLIKEAQKSNQRIRQAPKFILMTLKVAGASQELENTAGIKFEVPAYTIFTNLQIVSKKKFSKVGVFYRASFSGFFEESKKFLAKENIELLGECLDCGLTGKIPSATVAKGLREGMVKLADRKVEVIWMLADNILVNEATLKGFWLTQFKTHALPVVVPLPNLASLDLNLGMFGVWPDYRQLGMQAAQQVIQVFESGESASSLGLESLVSVQMVLNLEMAKRVKWEINQEKLDRISTTLKKN